MKVLICEDDNLTMKINNVLLENYFEQRHMRMPETVLKREIDLETDQDLLKDIDIAFLDIDLKGSVNGIHLAKAIKLRNPYVVLIFITSYDNYAIDACKLQACAFLQKPVKPELFDEAVTRALLFLNGLRITKMNRMITLHSHATVKERSICCIEKISETKDIRVTTSSESYTFRGTLKEMQKKLSSSFVRISRAAIINVFYIFKINNGVQELNNEKVFLLSPAKEREVKILCSRLNV